MKTISTTDLRLITGLAHLTTLQIVDPANDSLVNPYLAEMGFDLTFGLEYGAYQHRNLQNKVVVDFMIAGNIDINHGKLRSHWSTAEDRIIGCGYLDHSLAKEMMNASCTSVSYDTIHSLDSDESKNIQRELESYVDPEESARITNLMDILNEMLYAVRGPQLNAAGTLKTPEEYASPEDAPKFFRNKKKKRVAQTAE